MSLVSYAQLLRVVGDFTRPLVEGEEIFKRNHLICVGKKFETEDEIGVVALCLQSSHIDSKPHEVNVVLSKVGDNVKCNCTCKAGLSEKCKHTVATLIHLNRTNTSNDLEDLSCTDLAQQWGKIKESTKHEYRPQPITSLCHVRKKSKIYSRGVPEPTPDMKREFLHTLMSSHPESELAIHQSCSRQKCHDEVGNTSSHAQELISMIVEEQLNMETFLDLQEAANDALQSRSAEEKEFYSSYVALTKDKVSEVCIRTVVQAGAEWSEFRKIRITGSICYSLFTYTRNRQPDWFRKLESVYYPKFSGNSATQHGFKYEKKAKLLYAKITGRQSTSIGVISSAILPWLAYSADGVSSDSNGLRRLIEVKCPIMGKKVTAESVLQGSTFFHKESQSLKMKHPYYGQIQLGMFLLNCKFCDFVVYSSFDDSLVIKEVAYNEEFTTKMLETLANVYFTQILPWIVAKKQQG